MRHIDGSYTQQTVIRLFDRAEGLIRDMKSILDRNKSWYESPNDINGTQDISLLETHIVVLLNLVSLGVTVEAASFSEAYEETNELKKMHITNSIYGYLIFHAINVMVITLLDLLNENTTKTIQLCRKFLIEKFDNHIRDKFIFEGNHDLLQLISSLESLQIQADVVDIMRIRNVDYAVWKEETLNFENEIVRIRYCF